MRSAVTSKVGRGRADSGRSKGDFLEQMIGSWTVKQSNVRRRRKSNTVLALRAQAPTLDEAGNMVKIKHSRIL